MPPSEKERTQSLIGSENLESMEWEKNPVIEHTYYLMVELNYPRRKARRLAERMYKRGKL